MEIKVQIKTVYGNEQVYPACPKALMFAQIAGTKTLQPAALKLIQSLGYTITVENPSYVVA